MSDSIQINPQHPEIRELLMTNSWLRKCYDCKLNETETIIVLVKEIEHLKDQMMRLETRSPFIIKVEE